MMLIDRAADAAWWYSSPWTLLLMLILMPFVVWGGHWLNQRIGRYGILLFAVVVWVLLMLHGWSTS